MKKQSSKFLIQYFIPILGLFLFLSHHKDSKDSDDAAAHLFWLEYYHLNAAILLAAIFKFYFLNRY